MLINGNFYIIYSLIRLKLIISDEGQVVGYKTISSEGDD